METTTKREIRKMKLEIKIMIEKLIRDIISDKTKLEYLIECIIILENQYPNEIYLHHSKAELLKCSRWLGFLKKPYSIYYFGNYINKIDNPDILKLLKSIFEFFNHSRID